MALTFTGTLGVATAGREEIRTLIIGILGCNIAWGIVDAVMFLLNALGERGHGMQTIHAVHDAATTQEAHRIIGSAMPPVLASIMGAEDLEKLRRGLLRMRDVRSSPSLTRDDWVGALLVFLSTFPVVIPFLLFSRVSLALRISNLVVIVMLFVLGYRLGQHSGHTPWRMGASMVLLGLVLVGVAIVLGG